MTAQHREELVYNDQVYYLATEPLKPYLDKNKIKFSKRPKHGIQPSRRMPSGMHPTFRLLSFKLFSLRF